MDIHLISNPEIQTENAVFSDAYFGVLISEITMQIKT